VRSATRAETMMWEEEWVRCAKNLNQWEVLKEFAGQIGNPELQLDAAWRIGDWIGLKVRARCVLDSPRRLRPVGSAGTSTHRMAL
jgi:hypothetical protein